MRTQSASYSKRASYPNRATDFKRTKLRPPPFRGVWVRLACSHTQKMLINLVRFKGWNGTSVKTPKAEKSLASCSSSPVICLSCPCCSWKSTGLLLQHPKTSPRHLFHSLRLSGTLCQLILCYTNQIKCTNSALFKLTRISSLDPKECCFAFQMNWVNISTPVYSNEGNKHYCNQCNLGIYLLGIHVDRSFGLTYRLDQS